MSEDSIQTKARGLIYGIKREIYDREAGPSKKAAADSKKAKISRIVVYFSGQTDEADIFCGPVVDTYLQCAKNEIGIVIPAAYKEPIMPLFHSLPWSYREFRLSSNPQ